ncbi:hypothetical protein IT407_01030 [Candidatus Uhrbacteria bacterium]|nr:hypothetical protein [Candidatus Uhrbacteria bacterium]
MLGVLGCFGSLVIIGKLEDVQVLMTVSTNRTFLFPSLNVRPGTLRFFLTEAKDWRAHPKLVVDAFAKAFFQE